MELDFAEIHLVDLDRDLRYRSTLEGKAKLDHRYRYLALSRNFGHQIAITAGIEAASGDAVVVMDTDLLRHLALAERKNPGVGDSEMSELYAGSVVWIKA